MAHFAEIDENNIVKQIVIVDNEQEHRGQEFLANDLGFGGTWIQTSYNTLRGVHVNGGTPLRKNYAVIGGVYDSTRDAFYASQPFPSWTLNEDTCIWEAPIPAPVSEQIYEWSEETQAWVEVTL